MSFLLDFFLARSRTMSICHLNDDCLLALFDKFSLQELIHLRVICLRWRHLIEHVLFRRQQSLKLFGSRQDVRWYLDTIIEHNLECDSRFILKPIGGDDDLILSADKVGGHLVSNHFLSELFPNIKTFLYYNSSYSRNFDLGYLLADWGRSQLSTLIVDTLQSTNQNEPIEMPYLRSLYFLDRRPQFGSLVGCFPQLECLMVDSRHKGKVLLQLDGQKCNELRLYCTVVNEFVENVFSQMTHLRENLTRLTLVYDTVEMCADKCRLALKLVCRHFGSLTYLKLTLVKELSLSDIICELSYLPHLCDLYLELRAHCNQLLQANLVSTLPSLASIRFLHLTFNHPLFRLDRLAYSIGHLFPRLQLLKLNAGHHNELKSLIDKSFNGSPFEVQLVRYRFPFIIDFSPFSGRHRMY